MSNAGRFGKRAAFLAPAPAPARQSQAAVEPEAEGQEAPEMASWQVAASGDTR